MNRSLPVAVAILVLLTVGGPEPSLANRPQKQGLVSKTKARVKRAWSRFRRKPPEIRRIHINPRAIGDWSTVCSIASNANAVLLPLGLFSSSGMIVSGSIKWATAKSDRERSNATHQMLWGVQDGVRVGTVAATHLTEKGMIHTAGATAGAIGGAIQTGVGVFEICSAIKDLRRENPQRNKKKNKERIVVGVLDTCAGACWTASSVGVLTPVTLPAFLSLALARVLYTNRTTIKTFGKNVGSLLKTGSWPKNPRQIKRKPPGSHPKPAATIVTSPISREVGKVAAKGPGTRVVLTPNGEAAVVSPASVITVEGETKHAEVITPIEKKGSR